MALKLNPQTLPFHHPTLNLPAEPQASPIFTHTHRPSDQSELQQKLNTILKRVVGENTYSPSSSSSSSISNSPSHLSTPSSSSSPPSVPLSSLNETDDETRSNYDDEEKGPTPLLEAATTPSISSPSSYVSLASSNPYTLDPADLACRLSVISPEPSAREDRHGEDTARLARQLDRAHAFVKAEECAALQVLLGQTLLG